MKINLPHKWEPKSYQIPLLQYLWNGGRRAVAVWHRRAGKDSTAMNYAATVAHKDIGMYWHMLPTTAQGRRVVWNGINKDGQRFIDQAFPKEIRKSVNKTEMTIELKCGSMYQIVGSDNYDNLVGTNPVGIIFSEWALADPRAWDYFRPILLENRGWAIFVYTPRGTNHGYSLYKMAKRNPQWYSELLTVEDTGIVTKEQIQQEVDEGMEYELVQQEYYCSFDAPMPGTYYGEVMNKLERSKPPRLTSIPHDPSHPVQTWWDFGYNDSNAITFTQYIAGEWRFIDFEHGVNKSIADWASMLKSEKPYKYNFHGAPHDVEQHSLQTGSTLKDYASNFGIEFTAIPRTKSIVDSLNNTRMQLSRVWIDFTKCEFLIDALKSYRREWDEKNKVYRAKPVHDWASNPADSVRTWAEGHKYMDKDSDIIHIANHPSAVTYDPLNPLATMGRGHTVNLGQDLDISNTVIFEDASDVFH